MSEFYRSTNLNHSSLHLHSPIASGNNRVQINKTFVPESTQIQRVFSPTNNHQNVKFNTQPYRPYESTSSINPPQLIYRPSSFSRILPDQKSQTFKNENESLKQILMETTKNFMAEMTKSIGEIAKAQVEAMLKEKISQQNKNLNSDRQKKLIKNQHQQKDRKFYTRGLSLQQQSKHKGLNGFLGKMLSLDTSQQVQKDFGRTSLKTNSFNQNQNSEKPRLEAESEPDIKQVLNQMRKIVQNRKEPRSNWLDVDLDKIGEGNKKDRMHQLKRRVFKIIEEVISVSFNMHYKDGVEFDKVKAYCCENFIVNFCKLVKMNAITPKEMKIIQDQLQDEVLPYLNLSYPRSEEKVSNKELKNKISEKDIFNQNRFDVVFNSKVELSTKQSETNSEIMQIMNYIIKLPDQKVIEMTREMSGKCEPQFNSEEKTLFQHFERDMEAIFAKVEKKDLTHNLYKLSSREEDQIKTNMGNKSWSNTQQLMRKLDEEILNPSQKDQNDDRLILETVSKYIVEGRQNSFKQKQLQQEQQKQKQQQEQQYKEKVHSYTKFKIGRKISPNVEPYTAEQIEEGVLFFNDSSVARVLMKWVEALEAQIKDPAKSLYLRDQPFRLNNAQETYLLSTQARIRELYEFYKRTSKVIEEKSQDIKNNAREIFLEAIKSFEHSQRFKAYKQFSSSNDALVGHICTILLKSRENHITSYLNMILGEIKYIQQEYQWLIEDKKIGLKSRPSLINMKLGDLMRCQITSKPKEIIALYQYISLLCKSDPKKFEMVRVKDRFNTPNKDILINLYYHQKIMVEIQLAIKIQSGFISCSDRFSHFIYEMIRAFLGPINQVCSIWSLYSPKSQFFIQKFSELNVRGKPPFKDSKGCVHSYEDQQKDLKLPFTCSSCGVLYYNSSTSRKQCIHCKVYECCVCTIKSNQQAYVQTQCPEYEIKKERIVGEIFYALDILTNSKYIKTMLKLQINGKLEAYSMKIESTQDEKNPQLKVTGVKSQYEISKRTKLNLKRQFFEQTHIILQKKSMAKRQQDSKLVDEVIKQILQSYYLPRRAKVVINKSQSFMKLTLITNPKIKPVTKGEIVTNIIHKNIKYLSQIEKLNLNENGLIDLKIGGKMPNARNVVLNHNQLSTLNLLGFKNLVSLELAHNKIRSLQSLSMTDCVNLKRLMLDDNDIYSVEGLPAELVHLQFLSLSKNKIQFIQDIPHYKKIKTLNLNQNRLVDLTGIQKLVTLEELTLKQNKKLADSGIQFLRNLKLLKKLNLNNINLRKALLQGYLSQKDPNLEKMNSPAEMEKIESLIAFKSLTQLECLDAGSNGILAIAKIPELIKLKELNLSRNNLTSTQNLQNFLNLKWLCLKKNQITEIKSLAALKNLAWLDLSKNKISSKDLVIISQLKNLHEIELSENNLVTLEGIGSLPKLYELSCRSNMLNSLKGIQRLTSLEHLDARNNREIFQITGLDNLKVLFELKLSGNKIIELSNLKKVQSLKILELNRCDLGKIKLIPPLKNLQELYLNDNSIQTLEGLSNFSSLKKLEITENDIVVVEQDLKGLNNLSYLSFSLNDKIELEYIANTESIQVIKIHQPKEPTEKQSHDLVALSLLGYNIQFINPELKKTDGDSNNEGQLHESVSL